MARHENQCYIQHVHVTGDKPLELCLWFVYPPVQLQPEEYIIIKNLLHEDNNNCYPNVSSEDQ